MKVFIIKASDTELIADMAYIRHCVEDMNETYGDKESYLFLKKTTGTYSRSSKKTRFQKYE